MWSCRVGPDRVQGTGVIAMAARVFSFAGWFASCGPDGSEQAPKLYLSGVYIDERFWDLCLDY